MDRRFVIGRAPNLNRVQVTPCPDGDVVSGTLQVPSPSRLSCLAREVWMSCRNDGFDSAACKHNTTVTRIAGNNDTAYRL